MLGLRYFEDGVVQSYLNVDINKVSEPVFKLKCFLLLKA